MRKPLDIERWERKEHFYFFKDFVEPFFGISAEINCAKAYQKCKEKGYSFFLYYLHKTLESANSIENFRYQYDGDQIWIYDMVHATPTILRENNTFGFSYLDYHPDFELFSIHAQKEIEKVKARDDLIPAENNSNVIHFSSLPWIDFTSFSHARNFDGIDSCPKISFGKITETNGVKTMSVSIHVHHALMDGYHVGQFLDLLQELMND